MTLNILENYDFSQIEHGSFDYYHLLIEALKKSFQHRNEVLTDPAFSHIPLDRLLDKRYAKQLAEEIGDTAAPALSRPVGSDTAYAAVRDAEGNAVSFIQSLYFEFGSAVTAGKTGILLQNRGSFFRWMNPMSIHLNPASGRSTLSCRRWPVKKESRTSCTEPREEKASRKLRQR